MIALTTQPPAATEERPVPAGDGCARPPSELESWGRFPRADQRAVPLHWRSDPLPPAGGGSLLPRGQGRSYGDCCLDDGGTLLLTAGLDRFIRFDPISGVLACEGGVTLGAILERFARQGWFLPVVPGTKHVSVGGAIANDIHGRNHHRAGAFGRHVRRIELVRSDGERITCSRTERPEWFAATIGGLGLTGLVAAAELELRRVPSEGIVSEAIPFAGIDGFFELSAASDAAAEYTVAWVDPLARGRHLGRGVFHRGEHSQPFRAVRTRRRSIPLPFEVPGFLLNRGARRAIGAAYHAWHRASPGRRVVHYDRFFFPLDGLERWNRVHGRRGLLQFHCVVPREAARDAVHALLARTAASGRASFLGVLKELGDLPSPGLLSFPRPGTMLAVDFPLRGQATLELLRELEAIALDAGGAIYPAKDACMSPRAFDASFPRWRELARFADPAFSSSFWRRVTRAEEAEGRATAPPAADGADRPGEEAQ